ncbi:MAG: MucB/RseB C-terminal domain-containing protein [Armatimonadota bacterium]|nr:MucB/RseB C-terminal domain-containing protein [bacterium]
MNKSRALIIAAAVSALGIVIYPQTPNVDGRNILQKVLRAQHSLSYNSVQEHTQSLYGQNIRSTITLRHDGRASLGNDRLESLIYQNYTPLVEGRDHIAGRDTWVLRLKPKAKHRPWKQLWVDKKTSAVLASRDWTARNKIKRSMKTVSIHYIHNNRMSAAPTPDTQPQKLPASLHKMKIPAGFVLTDSETDKSGRSSHCTYSDGLYSISVNVNQPSAKKSVCNEPMDFGQGFIYVTRRQGKKVIVIADLLPEEIAKIAHSSAR